MDNWLEVTVETTDLQMEGLCARLTMNGAEGLVMESEEAEPAVLGLCGRRPAGTDGGSGSGEILCAR